MAAERFFIYRCGATTSCALTATKDEPRLPPTGHAKAWTLWMLITRHQVEDGVYGFALDCAMAKIRADGFFLFTGSAKLLGPQMPVILPPQGVS